MTEARGTKRFKVRQKDRDDSEREAAWFYGELGGRVPEEGTVEPRVREAAVAIHASLQSIPAFHRGALSLVHTKRAWPGALRSRYKSLTSLVVRLDCVKHPAIGRPVDHLEREAVERLSTLADIADSERPSKAKRDAEDALCALSARAFQHESLALRALARVRGPIGCRVPRRARVEVEE